MIHPLSNVSSKHIGDRTRVWQYAIILEDARIGADCNICSHTFIESDVTLGDNVTLKPGVYLWDGITIENNVFIGPNVTFTNDKYPRSKQTFELKRTLVRQGASIGAGAIILGGIEIGEYALIGAGSLVTKDVPSRALVKGSPAKICSWLNEDGSKMISSGKNYIDNQGKSWTVRENKLVLI